MSMIDIIYVVLFFIVGVAFGSFFNVVGLRLPKSETIVKGRSHCTSCNHKLKFYELIPLISFIIQKGKCNYCKEKISTIYPLIELVTGIMFAVAFYSFGLSLELLIALSIISLTSIIIVSDLTYLIISDEVLIVISLILITVQFFLIGPFDTLFYVLNGLLMFAIMYLFMLLGNKLFKKESLGGGDIKLMFVVGLILHPLLALFTIFLASLFALPFAVLLLKTNDDHVIPFGPFICLGLLLIYFTKIDYNSLLIFLGF